MPQHIEDLVIVDCRFSIVRLPATNYGPIRQALTTSCRFGSFQLIDITFMPGALFEQR
jgi:hypothetical protein